MWYFVVELGSRPDVWVVCVIVALLVAHLLYDKIDPPGGPEPPEQRPCGFIPRNTSFDPGPPCSYCGDHRHAVKDCHEARALGNYIFGPPNW